MWRGFGSTCSGTCELPRLPCLPSSHTLLPATCPSPPHSRNPPATAAWRRRWRREEREGGGRGKGEEEEEGEARRRGRKNKGKGRRGRGWMKLGGGVGGGSEGRMRKIFQPHPCDSPLQRIWKLLLGGLKEDSVPKGNCAPPGFQVIYSQTTPCALKSVSSFAEAGYDLQRWQLGSSCQYPPARPRTVTVSFIINQL